VAAREPERELIRRALPFFPPVALVAFVIGVAVSSAGAGWSAGLAIVVVAANLVASGLSLAWAAGISPTAVFAVGLGGFGLRIAVFAALLLALRTFSWFSPVAFTAAFIPATIVLLGFEMRSMASPKVQADLWYFREQPR
jgi:hypothetical protein